MSEPTTSNRFVHTLRLQVTPQQHRILMVRMDMARRVYNACLGEALRREALLRRLPQWQAAVALPKRDSGAAAERKRLMKEAYQAADLAKKRYLYPFVDHRIRQAHIRFHTDAVECRALADRAMRAVEKWVKTRRPNAFLRGKPHFIPLGEPVSMESNAIHYEDDRILWRVGSDCTPRGSLVALQVWYRRQDTEDVEGHALRSPIRYVRLLYDEGFWKAQLICEGEPTLRYVGADAVVGLDMGPSWIAIVSGDQVIHEPYFPALEKPYREVKRLQRKLDRSLRAMNPQNYDVQGKVLKGKRGKKHWVLSQHFHRTRRELHRINRQLLTQRKQAHAALIRRIMALGIHIRTEKIHYRSWQASWGKSLRYMAPGAFLALLRRRVTDARVGGSLEEFATATTALSQTCVCGAKVKKPLSVRIHQCSCGVGPVQRDKFSAFLAQFVTTTSGGSTLDSSQARAAWERGFMLVPHLSKEGTFVANPLGSELESPEYSGERTCVVHESVLVAYDEGACTSGSD